MVCCSKRAERSSCDDDNYLCSTRGSPSCACPLSAVWSPTRWAGNGYSPLFWWCGMQSVSSGVLRLNSMEPLLYFGQSPSTQRDGRKHWEPNSWKDSWRKLGSTVSLHSTS